MTNLRLVAARIINVVSDGDSLTEVLNQQLKQIKLARDRAFVQAIAFGVCRFYFRLDAILNLLLKKPMKAKDSLIHALLLVGLFQLIYMRVPSHAAIKETVDAGKELRFAWIPGFINAILREFIRQENRIEKQLLHDEEAKYSHPIWFIEKIKKAWPAYYDSILTANNEYPPLTLRVNQSKLSTDDYLTQLKLNQIEAQKAAFVKSGVILNCPVPVEHLPGFEEGFISVQDSAAQLAAEILDPKENSYILDACAAPGGKLLHLLEQENKINVVAIEKDPKRITSIQENLQRLNLSAKLICDDATNIHQWWDGQFFDVVLLDAPCSATGVIRRHPDIKILREQADIKKLSEQQLKLLTALWQVVKENGKLLYVTCSILPDENVDVVKSFLKQHANAEEVKIDADWGIACEIGRQILPGMYQMDGFYYALLKKIKLP